MPARLNIATDRARRLPFMFRPISSALAKFSPRISGLLPSYRPKTTSSAAPPMANPKSDSEQTAPETVDAGAARDLVLSGSHRYLDVRTPEEFEKGHYEGAVNVPYMFFTTDGKFENTQFLEQVSAAFSKDDLIVVACASGIRSIRAATLLLNSGFNHVKNMSGGYPAWVEHALDKSKIAAKL